MAHTMLGLALCFGSALALSSNEVYFENVGSVEFDMTDHSIGNSDDWGGVENGHNQYFIVSADRHGDAKPANFFNNALGPSNMVGNRVDSDQMPGKLNFAVIGTLSMNVGGLLVSCPFIRIGQGHTDDYNNWWMGGESCFKDGNSASGTVVCVCNDGARVAFTTQSGSSYKFSAELTNQCALIQERKGYWTPIAANAGETVTFKYTSASESYTQTDFMESLTATYSSPEFEFGSLELTAEESYEYVTENTQSVSFEQECTCTVPEGMRLWQWTYSVTTNCGLNKMFSCYCLALPLDAGMPCCLAGYNDPSDPQNCLGEKKNMCASLSFV